MENLKFAPIGGGTLDQIDLLHQFTIPPELIIKLLGLDEAETVVDDDFMVFPILFDCFQKSTIENELNSGPDPKTFLNSLLSPWDYFNTPTAPPRLQQLQELIINKPAIYHLEPPAVWNDTSDSRPKWKIYDITFL